MKRRSFPIPYALPVVTALALLLAFGCGGFESEAEIADGDTEREAEAVGDGDIDLTPIAVKAPANWNANAKRTPSGIHLSYQHDPATSVTLQWETPELSAKAYTPKVWLVPATLVDGADPTTFEQDVTLPYVAPLVVTGAGEPYCSKYICANDKPDAMLWVAEATNLAPDTVYYYRVGTFDAFDDATGEFQAPDFSPVYHFKTGLPKGDETSFKVGFGSDSQSWFETITDDDTIIRDTYGNAVRFWLFGGDLVEMGSQKEELGWMEVMRPLIRYYPFMPVQGNHDIMDGVFFGHWALPRMAAPLDPGDQERAWSFTYGNAHFVGLNSTGESIATREVAWLESDLAAARADKDITWIVAIFHHPAYSSSTAHGSTDYVDRLWVPLFDTYNVDLCLSGHDHDYERTKPMKGGQIADAGKGTVYIVSGGFYSQKSYGNGTSDFTAVSFDGASKSHVILTFSGKTLTGQAYKGNHEPLDSFALSK